MFDCDAITFCETSGQPHSGENRRLSAPSCRYETGSDDALRDA